MRDHILFVWAFLGFPQNNQGSSFQLEKLFCGEKKVKGLEVGSRVHFLDSLQKRKFFSL